MDITMKVLFVTRFTLYLLSAASHKAAADYILRHVCVCVINK